MKNVVPKVWDLPVIAGSRYSNPADQPGFDPGDVDIHYDDFSGPVLNRDDSSATKISWAQNREGGTRIGNYFDLKDANDAINRSFWYRTVGPSDLPAVVSAPFPFPSQKALLWEVYPQLATASEDHQADGHLQNNDLPDHYFVQNWYLLVDDSATTNTMPSDLNAGNKLMYPAASHPGGLCLVTFGHRCFEHQDPNYTSGERAAFEASTVPHNRMYVSVTGKEAGPLYRMVNTDCTEPPQAECYQNMSKQHLVANQWMLYRFEFDFSQEDKLVVRVWNSPNGTSDLTLILDTDQPGITWPSDGNAGGELAILQQPTIIQAQPLNDPAGGTDTGRIWMVQGEFAIATTADRLPSYG